jgi:hypothetical protein
MKLLAGWNLNKIHWRDDQDRQLDATHRGLLRVTHGQEIHTEFEMPYGATHVLISGKFDIGAPSFRARLTEIDWNGVPLREPRSFWIEAAGEGKRAVLCSKLSPDAAKVRIALAGTHPSEDARLRALSVEILRSPGGCDLPLGAVGLIYHAPDEIPNAIQECVDHYVHYRSTAKEFSRGWREFHNAGRLVSEIGLQSGGSFHRDPTYSAIANLTA